MTSGKQARKQRQAAARPPVRSTEARRASPTVLLAALAGFLGIALAVVLVVFFTGGSGSSGVSGTTLPDSGVIARQFRGIPQQGNLLGKVSAPVTLIEYIDLQCPVCRQFETEVMPTVFERYVRTGKLKVEVRPISFIGPDSERGRRAMIVAEQQDKAFNFSQILYFNQGPENGGWLDETMVANAAASVGLDANAVTSNLDSKSVADREKTYDQQLQADKVSGTPTVLVGKSGGKLTEVSPGLAPSLQELSAVIERALKG